MRRIIEKLLIISRQICFRTTNQSVWQEEIFFIDSYHPSGFKERGQLPSAEPSIRSWHSYHILRNAKIDIFKGSMRLAVDKLGRVEVTEPGSFEVNEDNNPSLY
ncbi:hypothetical protein RHMOL_Rhmol07G0190600 [Rhododendron molle]|uniref:Uncharacterized protein n=1 Tax=Rhododendron molle TaxID=49168 RepID=A0ACC0N3H2_RHOML|nr:hypothetical protein RHMOL_Rhmol07G0190600 [Rhododendron molle]